MPRARKRGSLARGISLVGRVPLDVGLDLATPALGIGQRSLQQEAMRIDVAHARASRSEHGRELHQGRVLEDVAKISDAPALTIDGASHALSHYQTGTSWQGFGRL